MTATRSTSPYGFSSTAADVISGVDLSGRRAVVTGAASGIGVETARALASTGADVTLAVRNLEAGSNVANGIAETLPSGAGALQVARLDLADPGLGGELCARMDGAVAHPHQQRRRDGPTTANPHAGRA